MNWALKILPIIGSLLGGPLSGVAVQAVGKALGIENTTEEKVKQVLSSGSLTVEQMASLQAAEAELKVKIAELGIKLEELDVRDRESAREMQIRVGSFVPHLIGLLFVGEYLYIVNCLLSGEMKLWENATLTMILGGLTSGVAMILGFYFGASHAKASEVKPNG